MLLWGAVMYGAQVSCLLEAQPIRAMKSAGQNSGVRIRVTISGSQAEDERFQPMADLRLLICGVPGDGSAVAPVSIMAKAAIPRVSRLQKSRLAKI